MIAYFCLLYASYFSTCKKYFDMQDSYVNYVECYEGLSISGATIEKVNYLYLVKRLAPDKTLIENVDAGHLDRTEYNLLSKKKKTQTTAVTDDERLSVY